MDDASLPACSDQIHTPRTLTQADWKWIKFQPGSGYGTFSPSLFEAFLSASGFRSGRLGVPPTLPDWAVDETPEQHKKWQRMGIDCEVTYFAQARYTGRIKIGHTKQSVHARVSQLAHANDGEDSVLLCYRLGGHFEKLYHEAFYTWALGHEWFAPHPDILAEVERINTVANFTGPFTATQPCAVPAELANGGG